MRCPVCGSKMIDGKICKYCNVTCEQVLTASNKEAKKAFKEKRYSDVCYTTDIPEDVNKRKLILFTVFLGWFGVGYFYIGRLFKGLFCAISSGLSILFALLQYCINNYGMGGADFVKVGMSIASFLMMIDLLFWIFDIFGFIFKTYKVPVVLPKEVNNVKHRSLK